MALGKIRIVKKRASLSFDNGLTKCDEETTHYLCEVWSMKKSTSANCMEFWKFDSIEIFLNYARLADESWLVHTPVFTKSWEKYVDFSPEKNII